MNTQSKGYRTGEGKLIFLFVYINTLEQLYILNPGHSMGARMCEFYEQSKYISVAPPN